MDALEAIFTRRSIRKFTDAPVSPEDVRTLLEAAMSAPTAAGVQPWRFIVLTDRRRTGRRPLRSSCREHDPAGPAGHSGLRRYDFGTIRRILGAGLLRRNAEYSSCSACTWAGFLLVRHSQPARTGRGGPQTFQPACWKPALSALPSLGIPQNPSPPKNATTKTKFAITYGHKQTFIRRIPCTSLPSTEAPALTATHPA